MNDNITAKSKRQIAILANIETTTSLALERADEFLLSGNEAFKKESLEIWKKNAEYLNTLKKNTNGLSKEQLNYFESLKKGINQLGPLLEEIIKIRSGDEWNHANHLLKIKAAPSAFRIKNLLNDMTVIQEQLLENDVETLSSKTHFLIVLLVALFVSAALISGLLSVNISHSVSEPLVEICKLADELAHGHYHEKRLPVNSRNELGTLSQSFNQLLDRLQKEHPENKE